MLTRRTFLTTIAAAPLARFCKTEPVRPYVFQRNVISIAEAERKYGLKPGTLRNFRGYNSREQVEIKATITGATLAEVEQRIAAATQGTL